MGKNVAWLVGMLVLVALVAAQHRVPTSVEKSPVPPVGNAAPPAPSVREISLTFPPEGEWALDANGFRLLLSITSYGPGKWDGKLQNEDGRWEELLNFQLPSPESPRGPWNLSFYRPGTRSHWRCTLRDGKLEGYYTHRMGRLFPRTSECPVTGTQPPPVGWKVGH